MATSAMVTEGVVLKHSSIAVAEVLSFDGPGGAATVIDATHLASTAKEKLMGLPDEGQFSFDANFIPGDTAQTAMRAARTARTLESFVLELTDAGPTTATFSAYVIEFKITGGVDDKITVSMTLEVSGAVTWA